LGSTEATPELRPRTNQAAPGQKEPSEHVAVDHSDVSAAANAASQESAKRTDRVKELREQFLNGSYQPDAAKVATKIVEEHLG
jgi:flagellar biosynthesis anti-sigma factor FlgM